MIKINRKGHRTGGGGGGGEIKKVQRLWERKRNKKNKRKFRRSLEEPKTIMWKKWGKPSMVNIPSKGRYKIRDHDICYLVKINPKYQL